MLADLPALPVYADFTPPAVTMRLAYTSRRSLRFDGLHATVALNEPGSFSVIVRDPNRRQISSGVVAIASVPNGGEATVTVRFGQAAKKKLRRGRKIRWTVVAEAQDGTGNRTIHNKRLWIG